jgi:riboflavin synthase
MFTGLVKDVGRIADAEDQTDGGRRLGIRTDLDTEDFEIGESVAVDGACLTVTELEGDVFSVDLSPETLEKTTLDECRVDDGVHLERALRVGDRLGGHFVQGHVDAVGSVTDRVDDGDAVVLRIEVPDGFERWLVDKGSITIDGVSLTVNAIDGREFEVALIPHTLEETKFDAYQPGDSVNLEGDMLGKYVERLTSREGGAAPETLPPTDGRTDDDHG